MDIENLKANLVNYSEKDLDALAAEIDAVRKTPKRWVVDLAGKLGFLAVAEGLGLESQQAAVDYEIARIDSQIESLNKLRAAILLLDVEA
jgi:hypothetical protein